MEASPEKAEEWALGSEADRDFFRRRMLMHQLCYTNTPFVMGLGYRTKDERDAAIRMMYCLKSIELANSDLCYERMRRIAHDFHVYADRACHGAD